MGDEVVLPENMDAWISRRDYWFVDDQEDKTPGKLKIEEEASEGSWFGLSPKCYFLGTDADHKIGAKGVPKNCGMTRKEFEEALYDSDRTVTRTFNKMQFHKKLGRMATIKMTKKSLNAAYAKLFVPDNLVTATPWDCIKKYSS